MQCLEHVVQACKYCHEKAKGFFKMHRYSDLKIRTITIRNLELLYYTIEPNHDEHTGLITSKHSLHIINHTCPSVLQNSVSFLKCLIPLADLSFSSYVKALP